MASTCFPFYMNYEPEITKAQKADDRHGLFSACFAQTMRNILKKEPVLYAAAKNLSDRNCNYADAFHLFIQDPSELMHKWFPSIEKDDATLEIYSYGKSMDDVRCDLKGLLAVAAAEARPQADAGEDQDQAGAASVQACSGGSLLAQGIVIGKSKLSDVQSGGSGVWSGIDGAGDGMTDEELAKFFGIREDTGEKLMVHGVHEKNLDAIAGVEELGLPPIEVSLFGCIVIYLWELRLIIYFLAVCGDHGHPREHARSRACHGYWIGGPLPFDLGRSGARA